MTDESCQAKRLIYLHGFNSSPESLKAKLLLAYARQKFPEKIEQGMLDVQVPALPFRPGEAVDLVEEILGGNADGVTLIGSSLGGFYSIYFAEKLGCKAVLVNPLVSLHEGMGDDFLGHHVNPYSGEPFEITETDAEYLQQLEVNEIVRQDNFFLLLEQGDPVLDYRIALEKFPAAKKVVLPGGTHRFQNFEKYIPAILEFAGIQQ